MTEKSTEDSLNDVSFVDDEQETLEIAQKEFEAAIDLAQKIRRDVEEEIKSHVVKDEKDQCGYCGQHFGPDDVVVEKNIYGQHWRFCDAQCYQDFLDASNFKDENLDTDADVSIEIEPEE